jgi:hypothetical protein
LDDSVCCYTGDCEDCNSDDEVANADIGVAGDAIALATMQEALYDYVAVLTGELTGEQRVDLVVLLRSGILTVEHLVFVLLDQAGLPTADEADPFKAKRHHFHTQKLTCQSKLDAPTEPLATEAIEAIAYRNKRGNGRLCSCGVARLVIDVLGHNDGCPEAKTGIDDGPRLPKRVVLEDKVRAWNDQYPVGTAVRFWPGTRRGRMLTGTTHSAAELVGGHTPSVWITGYAGCVALTHVEAL